jgi:hypothetical protein
MPWLTPEEAADPAHDVYYDPAYLRSVAGADEVRVLIQDALVLPLVLRPLPAWLAAGDLRDAESPYGYAAPLVRGPVDWSAVQAELAAHGVVNAFVRSHPLQAWCDLPPVTSAPTAVIPLDGGRAQAFAAARCATHRSQVKRALGLGFTATTDIAPADLTGFRALYDETMRRLNAAAFYIFASEAWGHLCRLGERLALITVRDAAGTIHNQALFLRGPQFAHYHLSARAAEAHNTAGNLLFEAASDWAVAHGCTAIHLGGGTTGAADDGLLRYKQRIGSADATFRTAGIVADAPAHAGLIARWAARSGSSPRWFQAYRQPVV